MKIFIVGSGKLANAILSSYLSFPSSELMKWESPDKTQDEKAIVVYAGSGRQLKECIEFCERTGSVFEDAFDMSCPLDKNSAQDSGNLQARL